MLADARRLEQEGRHDEAFASFVAAKAALRATTDYDFAAEEALFEALRRAFARELPLAGASTVTAAPLFVVGLPCTGTALLESIVAAHPAVASRAAPGAMVGALRQSTETEAGLPIDTAAIARLAGRSADTLGRSYLARAGAMPGARFVDGEAMNFLYVGAIAQALPRASIVCVQRGAMDSVWRIFTQRPSSVERGLEWSNSLMETAQYVLLFQRLEAFWRQRLPGRIHELSYEQFLADRDVQTRRMLAHCGLQPDPACLAAAASTQSDEGPMGAWRPYEAHLGEVADFFTANGIPID